MLRYSPCVAILLLLGKNFLVAQSTSTPIYQVTVVERSIDAVNYDYRAYPTRIDFKGTVMLPEAKGSASVESKRGHSEIDANFERLPAPQRFGKEYLTYVLWAITPEGRPHNLGELVVNSGDRAKLDVSTDLQAFGMIVTAEPYSAVRQPSDVVVLENRVRSDTLGIIKPIHARYELLPRGHYVWQPSSRFEADVAGLPRVSMDRYETMSQIYQAQNAIGIARQANAATHAPNTLAKAEQLLSEAQGFQAEKSMWRRSVQSAREAIQTAEDARLIAERRTQEEELRAARSQATAAEQAKTNAKLQAEAQVQRAREDADAAYQAKLRAQAEADRARADASAARAQAEAERSARQRMEGEVSRTNAVIQARQREERLKAERAALRGRLLESMNGVFTTRDTPRGLVASVYDAGFHGSVVRVTTADQLARLGRILVTNPGLQIEVQGHSEVPETEWLARERAEEVRRRLLNAGFATTAVTVRSMGNSTPVVASASARARTENRRVEIVVTGDPIGNQALWDRTYTISFRR